MLTGAGPGPFYGTHVKGWQAAPGQVEPISGINFLPFPGLVYGVHVSSGAVQEDGYARFLTGPGPGVQNPAAVKAWHFRGECLTQESAFHAFSFDYGVETAVQTSW